MAGQRKRYSADFKAKVALEAIRGELTIAQLVAKHGVHQTLIHGWKQQALDGMAGVFSAKAEAPAPVATAEIEKLHAKIGELVVERDFLRKASGRRAPVGGGRWSSPNTPDFRLFGNARCCRSAARITTGRCGERAPGI